MTQTCKLCLDHKNHQPKEPLKPWPVPKRPWEIVGTDLFQFEEADYLLTVDSYSGWFEINKLHSTKAKPVIDRLKVHFSRFGIPDLVISDSGSQFHSKEFKEFAQTWGFQHKESSPNFHSSNGLAEKAVQSAKRLLKKSKQEGSDYYLNLLNWRNIPRDNVLGSQAQRNLSRRTRTQVPITEELLLPKVKDPVKVHNRLNDLRQQQKSTYDRSAKPLPPLSVGDKVRMQTEKGYKTPAVVTNTSEPRSYIVRTEAGEYRRNRRHLLKVPDTNSEEANEPIMPTKDLMKEPSKTDSVPTIQDNPPTAQMNQTPNQYVTRSGRTVKPPQRYGDESVN